MDSLHARFHFLAGRSPPGIGADVHLEMEYRICKEAEYVTQVMEKVDDAKEHAEGYADGDGYGECSSRDSEQAFSHSPYECDGLCHRCPLSARFPISRMIF